MKLVKSWRNFKFKSGIVEHTLRKCDMRKKVIFVNIAFAKELLHYSMIINYPTVGFGKTLPGLASFLIKFSEISHETVTVFNTRAKNNILL